ncbi:MAG: L-aspartate oxidase [Chloroflexi bacterium]|nr:L-aspartate oxidase [Chloroflexota bacterium]
MKYYDYIVVGSGIAGLYSALLAQELGSVLILTKGSLDECNTKYAQGGIAAPVGKEDSPELHMKDTLAAGAGLCDPEAVRILTSEASDRITDLIRFGVAFDTLEGEITLTREGAHSLPRVLHAGGDATGAHIETALSQAARRSKARILEYSLVTEILLADGSVQGVRVLDNGTGFQKEFQCRFLILATGGAGQLYKFTTNPEVATGDGMALAFRAGAYVADMEFFQFHPTALRMPNVPTFLISEAVRGEGGILRNVHGRAFMKDYSPAGEMAPRDIVARAIVAEMKKTNSNNVFLDVTHLPTGTVTTRFPNIYRFCLEHGLDITKSLIPVAPAAHYMMGGVLTNIWGQTNVSGLLACGEVASTGVHGANRLASNSLLETLIFGKRVVERTKLVAQAATDWNEASHMYPDEGMAVCALPHRDVQGLEVPPPSLSALESLMWEKVGIIRSGEGLQEAANILAAWEKETGKPKDRASYELQNLVLVGRLITEAALIRKESRGAHFRTDFPEPSPAWQKHTLLIAKAQGHS